MDLIGIVLLSVALAVDAFAVSVALSVSKTVKLKRDKIKSAIVFGLFQGIMPLIGYSITLMLKIDDKYIVVVSFTLLCYLGLKFIIDALKNANNTCKNTVCLEDGCSESSCALTGKSRKITWSVLIIYALSTSIDALATGPVIHVLGYNIILCVLFISVITFCLSYVGFNASKLFKGKSNTMFEILAGIILLVIALNVLLK